MHTDEARTRLTFDALDTKVVARVVQRGPDGFQVAQSLPFLRLHGGVCDEHGRRGRLAGITVSVDGETPSLVLDVVYDDVRIGGMQSSRPARRDATVPFERPSDAPPRFVVVDVALTAPRPAPRPSWLAAALAWLRQATVGWSVSGY